LRLIRSLETKLPLATSIYGSNTSYYAIENEKILFVNVESDYGRIAPMLEAALFLSSNNTVFWVDVSQGFTNKSASVIQKLLTIANGGWIPDKLERVLNGDKLTFLKYVDFVSKFKEFDNFNMFFNQDEISRIKRAKTNENLIFRSDNRYLEHWFDERKADFQNLCQTLQVIIQTFKINRTFCWNGRFVKSTLVNIASAKCGIITSNIEWGSHFFGQYSFEIYKNDPRDPYDTLLRIEDLARRQELGLVNHSSFAEIREIVLENLDSEFTARFNQKAEFFNYDVVFFCSSLHESATTIDLSDYYERKQTQLIARIAKECALRNLSFCIRVHPNPSEPKYEAWENDYWQEFISKLDHPVGIFFADSEVSSYEIARRCKMSFAFDSTIVYELAVLGLPAQGLGPTFIGGAEEKAWLMKLDSSIFNNFLQCKVIAEDEIVRHMNYHLMYRGFAFSYFSKFDSRIFFSGSFLCKERGSESFLIKSLVLLKRLLGVSYLLRKL
jgi:hypothetical protein